MLGAFEYGWPQNSSSNSDKMNLDIVSTMKTFILVENLGALFVLFCFIELYYLPTRKFK